MIGSGNLLYGQCARCGGALTLGHECQPKPIDEATADKIRELVRTAIKASPTLEDYEISG